MNNLIVLIIILILCLCSYIFTENYNKIEHWIIDSGNPGHTVLILGGTHGNEPAGSVGIEQFLNSGIKISKGKIILIPRINKLGLDLNFRWGFNGFVPIDYNRNYSKDNSSKSFDFVNKQIIEFVTKSDFILDFHEGWGYSITQPDSMGSGIYPSNTELAKNIGNVMLVQITPFSLKIGTL